MASARISPARIAAYEVLRRVEQGGFASDLLRSRTASLSAPDAGLASELVFGVLRYRAQLDYLIERHSGRPVCRLDTEVALVLRLAIYQLRYLERIPAHAAVSEAVELVKRARKRSAAALVNAVLRKVDRAPVAWPDSAIELSMPSWLLERWQRRFGGETAAGIARAFLKPPERYVRVPDSRRGEAALRGLIPTALPGCFRLPDGAPGEFRLQDISSQAVVPLLELRPGQSFLDVCAAPGNKTAQALETPLRAVAADNKLEKLVKLRDLGADLVVADATRPLPFRRPFDRILLDAPCSGTGTLGRNPEIKWRLAPEDLERHHRRQVAMLREALEMLAPGGRLVYSTCSLEAEENESVVEEVVAAAPDRLHVEAIVRRIPGVDLGDGFFAAVLTSK